jgi:DNA-binding transcriptional LysR family regulator
MARAELSELNALLAVAEARSFTRAAARLGTSQSALSHTVRRLEERLGVRLLTRTTRSVAPTEAGQRLVDSLRPALDEIDARLEAVTALRDRPAGRIRITVSETAADTILWPALARFLPNYPDIQVELVIDQALTDIAAGRFDAGVRLGEHLERDMIAVPIGPPLRMAVVGSPAYFAKAPAPRTPHDLADHECINLRMATNGGLYVWEFENGGRALNVRVAGALTFNRSALTVRAAADGFGLACVPEDHVASLVAEGRLARVLEDWCPPFAGYHLYYPSRRHQPAAFALLVEALRYRVP